MHCHIVGVNSQKHVLPLSHGITSPRTMGTRFWRKTMVSSKEKVIVKEVPCVQRNGNHGEAILRRRGTRDRRSNIWGAERLLGI